MTFPFPFCGLLDGQIRKPGEGRDDSGANWRKRDVGELVQGAVAVEVGSQGPAALVRP